MQEDDRSEPFEDARRRRHWLRGWMATSEVDAFLALTPENLRYLTGHASSFLELWHEPGWAMALVSRTDPILLILPDWEADALRADAPDSYEIWSYPLWVHYEDRTAPAQPAELDRALSRPRMFDLGDVVPLVTEALKTRGIQAGKVASELGFMSQRMASLLFSRLPRLRLVDGMSALNRMRQVKDAGEIAVLRQAAEISSRALQRTALLIKAGMRTVELANVYDGFARHLGDGGLTGMAMQPWALIMTSGPDDQPHRERQELAHGDVVLFDVGMTMAGYHADLARCFSVGAPDSEQLRVYSALRAGHEAGLELVRPGVTLGDLFVKIADSIHDAGLTAYNRGHFGHSVGLEHSIEEPPFVSKGEATPLEEGMVLALETPFYARGLGSFNLENMLVVTRDGPEILTKLSHEMIAL